MLPAAAVVLLLAGCRHPSGSKAAVQTTAGQATISADGNHFQGTSLSSPTGAPQATPSPTAQPSPSKPEPTSTETAPVELAFVGDLMLGRSLAQKITEGKGNQIFESVREILQSGDLTVGNLECAIGEGGKKALKGYAFLAPPASASELKNAGFDLLSLANNHSLDYGTDVFRQTEQLLTDNGIQIIGAGDNASRARAPAVYEIRGLRVAFLAYADVPVERGGFNARSWAAGASTPGISWADDSGIVSDLQALKPRADFIVVLFHFGIEGSDLPSPRQVELSHLAIDNGAKLVVGSHPHLLQKEETYKSGVIYYSLGNFVFDGFSGSYNHGAILRVTISPSNPASYTLIPVLLVDGIPILGQQ
jgi:poly-gamma-glutamate capsule biosynthesis protein CapA/YwtB (metallophosphatase superfamily)